MQEREDVKGSELIEYRRERCVPAFTLSELTGSPVISPKLQRRASGRSSLFLPFTDLSSSRGRGYLTDDHVEE
jgi:hypothetical protein